MFAVALTHDISKRYPTRELTLVLHSSGVTKRSPEVCELFPEFNYLEVDDFTTRGTHDSLAQSFSIRSTFRALLRKFAIHTGVLAEENNGHSRKVHRWTLSVRGHYFHRTVDRDFLFLLRKRLEEIASINKEDFQQKIILHYRLGDLLELTNKNNISPHRSVNAFLEMLNTSELMIFSDSPTMAVSLLKEDLSESRIKTENLSTINTIWAASQAKAFIGTSSKISYWICLLRLLLDQQSQSLMPREDRMIIGAITSAEANVGYY